VHGRRVFVFSFSLGDQDEEEQEDEQTTDGDTHRNQTSLVGREYVVVIGTGSIFSDGDTIRVCVDGSSVPSDLEDDVISRALGEVELAALPDFDIDSFGSSLRVCRDCLEVLDVGLAFESGGGSTSQTGGGVESGLLDGLGGQLLGNDGDLIR